MLIDERENHVLLQNSYLPYCRSFPCYKINVVSLMIIIHCKYNKKGHRLGTANENTKQPHDGNTINDDDHHHHKHDVPAPIIDETLTDADREKIRADRAAAAEARLKKQGLPVQPKKAPPLDANAPLRGPNSKPTMTWSLG